MSDQLTVGSDPLTGGVEVQQQKFAFGKPSDFIKGTYVGKKDVNTPNGAAIIYEVKAQLGIFHPVTQDENGNNVPAENPVEVQEGEFYSIWGDRGKTIDQGFQRAKLGQIIGIQFMERVKSNTPGNKPWHKKKFVLFRMDESWMGEDSSTVETINADAPPFEW